MLRIFILAVFVVGFAIAAIWPEHLGTYQRKSATPGEINAEDRGQLNEYGFFFSSRRRHTRCYRAWSSDVCSSDLASPPTPSFDTRIFFSSGVSFSPAPAM